MNEVTTRIDVLRYNVGTCPACHEYLWAKVSVESRMSEPKLGGDGRATVYSSAHPVAMAVKHSCHPREDA